jgi:hypothetical protein
VTEERQGSTVKVKTPHQFRGGFKDFVCSWVEQGRVVEMVVRGIVPPPTIMAPAVKPVSVCIDESATFTPLINRIRELRLTHFCGDHCDNSVRAYYRDASA